MKDLMNMSLSQLEAALRTVTGAKASVQIWSQKTGFTVAIKASTLVWVGRGASLPAALDEALALASR